MSDLKPCPFCGGKAAPTVHFQYSWFAPVCTSCGVRGPSVRIQAGAGHQAMRELMNKADELWNTRAALLVHIQRGVGIQQRAALDAAPDQFRDATKMMADPAEAPMPKPVAYGFGNTAITGHTNRLMMVRIDIPGGDQYAGAFWHPLVLADEARTYGVAREAAGYARGLAEAGRDAERYRWLCGVATEQQWVELGGYTDKNIIDGVIDAALRGEVKP